MGVTMNKQPTELLKFPKKDRCHGFGMGYNAYEIDEWRGAMTHHLNDLFDDLFAELEDQKYDKSYGHELLVIDFADVIKPLLRLKQAVLGALEP